MNTQKRLNPKNDFLFKRLFGEAESKDVLIGLLNAIMNNQGKGLIVDLTVQDNKELNKEFVEDKEGRLDIRCETVDRIQINVEMQIERFLHMDKRSLFYVGRMFVGSIGAGGMYADLKKTIGINILDHDYLPLESYHSTFHFYEDDNKTFMLTDMLELHFIECRKFKKQMFDIHNALHRWLRFIDEYATTEQLEELMNMDPLIRKAEERLAHLSADYETRRLYEAREEALLDRNSLIDDARREGEARGEARGEASGEARGAKRTSHGIALKLLSKGIMSVQEIAELTGLTEAEVLEIRDKQ
jgi:predicted transposase/invertase (TIGR01784 family)